MFASTLFDYGIKDDHIFSGHISVHTTAAGFDLGDLVHDFHAAYVQSMRANRWNFIPRAV